VTGRRIVASAALLVMTAAVGLAFPVAAAAAPGPTNAPEWWFDSWQVPAVWAAGARGQGITIAEIDTGVNAALPELAGRILPGKDFGDPSADGRTDHDSDAFGHGTAMASVMVARPGVLSITGLAPDAQVLPIAVPIQGTTDVSSADQVPAAIRWAADHGGKIISMSLGGRRDPEHDTVPCPTDEQSAIDYAIARGSIVVAASGNSGLAGSPVEDPGVCLGVVSVGAIDATGAVTPFSSRHPYLTLVAPGAGIASLGRAPGTAYLGEGTSQATAITAAALALVWSKYPGLTGRDVVTRVLATLDHRFATHDLAYGYGSLATGQAVFAPVPSNAANPVYDALAPFLARQSAAAAASAQPAPPAAAVSTRPPGTFAAAARPGIFSGRVLVGTLLALGGLAAIAALIALRLTVRRRRRAAAAAIPPAPPPLPGFSPTGWQDISGPIWPFAPPPAPPGPGVR
jgi:subtilisin family serine protease